MVSSHLAFLTHEALANIAQTPLANLDAYFSGAPLENEICYRCLSSGGANKADSRSALADDAIDATRNFQTAAPSAFASAINLVTLISFRYDY